MKMVINFVISLVVFPSGVFSSQEKQDNIFKFICMGNFIVRKYHEQLISIQ
jgi:hypothetical protein